MIRAFFIFTTFCALCSIGCRKEIFTDDPGAKLEFETDTLQFDTIFTSVGSATHSFKVFNPNRESLKMDVRLAGGDRSPFRINIDGRATTHFKDYEFGGNDSIYIFAEVTIDPIGGNLPMVVTDSIMFEFNGGRQKVILEAFGQDVHLISDQKVACNAIWTNDKPYLINGGAVVDSNCKLTINPGVKVYCHQGSYLLVYGQLQVNGTADEPVLFSGDRLEKAYETTPGQWHGIIMPSGSQGNTIVHAIIENGNVGIQADSLPPAGGFNLKIEKSIIRNMASYGVFGKSSTILAKNVLIHSCGRFTFLCLYGGNYGFVNCTLDNTYFSAGRKLPSVVFNNSDIASRPPNPLKTVFLNNIIWGSLEDEIGFDLSGHGTVEAQFQYNILKVKEQGTFDTTNIVKTYPKFKNYQKGDYQLDTLSPAINKGAPFAPPYDVADDLDNKPRIGRPDIGCFERE